MDNENSKPKQNRWAKKAKGSQSVQRKNVSEYSPKTSL